LKSYVQDLWNKSSFKEVPDLDGKLVAEEGNEKEDDSSLPEGDAPTDGNAPSSSANPLAGRIQEPQASDSEEEGEEDEAETVAPVPIAPKRPRKALNKQAGKKAKTGPRMVQTMQTSSVKPAPAKDFELDDYVMLSESEDEDLPRLKG
jgi:hypothetical protein